MFLVNIFLCMVSLGSLEALRQWLGSTGSWMVLLGSQVVYGLSKTIFTIIIQYCPNGVVLTVHRLAGSTDVILSFRCVCRCGICRYPDVFGLT